MRCSSGGGRRLKARALHRAPASSFLLLQKMLQWRMKNRMMSCRQPHRPGALGTVLCYAEEAAGPLHARRGGSARSASCAWCSRKQKRASGQGTGSRTAAAKTMPKRAAAKRAVTLESDSEEDAVIDLSSPQVCYSEDVHAKLVRRMQRPCSVW